jgi:hypothetical protein
MNDTNGNGAPFQVALEGNALHIRFQLAAPRLFGPALDNLLSDAQRELPKLAGLFMKDILWRVVATLRQQVEARRRRVLEDLEESIAQFVGADRHISAASLPRW